MGLGKRRAAAAYPYKIQLYGTPSDDYAQAQLLMNKICSLTNQSGGKLGGLICPRLCQTCGRWGHTRQHCDLWARRYAEYHGEQVDLSATPHVQAVKVAHKPFKMPSREEVGENQYRWNMEYERLWKRFDAAWDCGKVTEPDWTDFCKSWDARFPEFPQGRPVAAETF